MLVLVSFGLVLLATILLVVGLLSENAINLIYLSIAASAAAAVVLYLAFRLARPKGPAGSDAPAPLAEDLQPTTVTAAATPTETAPPAPPTVPVAEPEPVPAPTADDWADDADWEVDAGDEVDFPIADYDDLSVAEIMPLLPQLYSDELDVVSEREQSGKNRATILAELDKLKVSDTEADELEASVAPEPAPPAPASAPSEPPPSLSGGSLLDGDGFDDEDDAFFPIADYDDLSVNQIVPLLSQLEVDELRDVQDREVAGANRTPIVSEIDRYLSGELEAYEWADDDQVETSEPDVAATEPAPSGDPASEQLPIANYPELVVSEVLIELDELSPAQLEQVLAYEAERDNRFGIVAEIKRRLEAASPATPTSARSSRPTSEPAAPKKASTRRTATRKAAAKKAATRTARKTTAKKATAKKAAAKKAAPKKTAAEKTSAKKAGAKTTGSKNAGAKKAGSTKSSTPRKAAKRVAKTATTTSFPIDNYDELGVVALRPMLPRLTPDELRQVREREASGRNRKTIINDIDKRLS